MRVCQLTLLLLSLGLTVAVPFVRTSSAQEKAGKRLAILIGVNGYTNRPFENLKYAERDVTELKAELEQSGFEVILLLGSGSGDAEATRRNIHDTLIDSSEGNKKFALRNVNVGDTVLVAFSGHGEQIPVEQDDGKTSEVPFYCPKHAESGVAGTQISINEVLDTLDKKKATTLVLVDACRKYVRPVLGKKSGASVDRAKVRSLRQGMGVMFSCGDRQESLEHLEAGGGHGLFFCSVLEALRTCRPNRQGQVTWNQLVPVIYERVPELTERLYPNLADRDRQRPQTIGNFDIDPVLITGGRVFVSKTTGMKFVRIPAGTFTMGSPAGEAGRYDDETSHEVVLKKDFYLGVTEVTQKEWKLVMGTSPWSGKEYVKEGDDYPATYVSWEDAVEYAKKLGEKDGEGYRLPTESEWEYACRGGTRTAYSFGADANLLKDHGWYDVNAWDVGEKYAHEVGHKKANPLGLFDMHGNVYEWCSDWKGDYPSGRVTDPTGPEQGSYRVIRGGSWGSTAREVRSASRLSFAPSYRLSNLGFRLALVPSGR